MNKAYDHTKVEGDLYKEWEEKGYFKPEVNADGEPYSVILPPPNANAPLHFGHAMYVVEDILIRYHRMKGHKALWLAGADHAGFETQFVYEKKLAEQGKSRFDFDRDTLFKNIWDYVHENRGGMEKQLRKLGFSLDWSRLKFTMDEDIVKIVYKTFKKLHEDNLLYRSERLVNYCTHDGTSFSDLEVVTEEAEGVLYEIAYPVKGGGEIVVATSRPETLYGDAAVMVHPDDTRYKDFVGKMVLLPLTDREIPVVADEFVKMDFGTGAVKVTPLHNFDDWAVGERHNLKGLQVIGFDGKMQNTKIVDGLYVKQGRVKTIELLQEKNFLRGESKYQTTRSKCYKCKNNIEPLPLEQWFIKMEGLAKPAIEAVKKGDIKIYPKSFEKLYFQFLENIRDWNISRQVVWGIRIPAFKCEKCANWEITAGEQVEKCAKCDSKDIIQDTDTFDTWFSSSQWPFATLQSLRVNPSGGDRGVKPSESQPEAKNDFETFYPTTVMETGYDILRWWVARMAMMGIYATGKVPFRNVVLHGLVNDPFGKKMSKSKGNVVNPLELVDEYGADAVRFALVYGTALGNDQALSYPKLEAARRFTNKLWNMGRFIIDFKPEDSKKEISDHNDDKEILEKLSGVIEKINSAFLQYRFNDISELLYEFTWHEFADKYIEGTKNRREDAQPCLEFVYATILKLLHPMMPFVTDEIYRKLTNSKDSIMIEKWPTA